MSQKFLIKEPAPTPPPNARPKHFHPPVPFSTSPPHSPQLLFPFHAINGLRHLPPAKKKRYAKLGPNAKVLGPLPPSKLRGFYNALDVFVDPTLRPQGLDLTIMEAMMCAKPVAATRLPSLKGSVFVADGEFGFMFAPNVAAAVDALELVVSEGPRRLAARGRACRDYAASMFTAKKMALAYERFHSAGDDAAKNPPLRGCSAVVTSTGVSVGAGENASSSEATEKEGEGEARRAGRAREASSSETVEESWGRKEKKRIKQSGGAALAGSEARKVEGVWARARTRARA
uniref:Glycosyl transferase family 1 domain-containing protein n=1 Tax=Ananas comosus var. bracteatus TaxID=296719 RepID=A0A6V7NZM2_ANACO|nr:unnamed protein product [Ananas comosus var. bracteatus]